MILRRNFIPAAAAEAGFSYEWIIEIDGRDVTDPISNLKFTQQTNSFGEKGFSIGSFEFDIFDTTGLYRTAIMNKNTVRLREKNSRCYPSKTFYIAKRLVNNNVCSFTAYDILSQTEKAFDSTSLGLFFDRGEKAPCGNVLSAVCSQCGISGGATSSGDGFEYINFAPEHVKDKSCADILEMVSEAMCGVWVANHFDQIVLSCLGEEYDTSLHGFISSQKYSELIHQGRQQIARLICTNSDTDKKADYGFITAGTVIEAESPFLVADTPLDGIVCSRIRNYVYSAWNCKKAIINEIIYSMTKIEFGTEEWEKEKLHVKKAVINVDNTGIYFSGGTDPRSDEEWNYDEYLQREVDTKVQYDKAAGNVCISKENGIRFINKNTSSARAAGSDEPEKYGFNVDVGGVTEYDGAIVSNKVFETAEKIDDNTVQINYEGGISYKYTLEKDDDGKIKLKKERIKEEGS